MTPPNEQPAGSTAGEQVEILSLATLRRIDEICDQAEAAVQGGQALDLAHHAGNWKEPERSVLVRELLAMDVYYRQQRGEQPRPASYYHCLPGHQQLIDSVLRELTGKSNSTTWSRSLEGTTPSPLGSAASPIGLSTSRRYLPLREIGRGAFGVVSLARDTELNRLVAIKQPLGAWVHSSAMAKVLRHEAELAAKLQHPSIVTIHDIGQDPQAAPYIVMEYIDGSSLRDRLKEAALPPRQAGQLLVKVAEGLEYAHQAGIIHRDLKPANILLDSKGNPHIADLGLAFSTKFSTREEDVLSGQRAGTYAYMAPEQLGGSGEPADGRCDVWALGVILYEMLAGRRPFDGEDRDQLRQQILDDDPADLRLLDRAIPAPLALICAKCLAKDPGDRPATAGELAEQLQGWLADTSEAATRRRMIVSTMVVLALVAFGLTVVVRRPPRSAPVSTGTRDPASQHSPRASTTAGSSSSDHVVFTIDRLTQPVGTLAAAVEAVGSGDTIEVHGNGTVASKPIQIQDKPLTIRAATNSAPTITLSDPYAFALLATDSDLTLEGLCLYRRSGTPARPRRKPSLVYVKGASLRMRHCQLRIDGQDRNACAVVDGGSDVALQDCAFDHDHCGGVYWRSTDRGRMVIEQCQFHGNAPVGLTFGHQRVPSVQIARSTLSGQEAAVVAILGDHQSFFRSEEIRRLRIDLVDSLVSGNMLLKLGLFGQIKRQFTREESIDCLLRSVQWFDRGCRFAIAQDYFVWTAPALADTPSGLRGLEHWHGLWRGVGSTDPASGAAMRGQPAEAAVRGLSLGDSASLRGSASHRLPSTKRQDSTRRRSAAHPSGDDGRVGQPALASEPTPFRVPSRGASYSTLPEAVAAASDGDTVQVDGQGPYLTDPVSILGKSLTLRGSGAVLELADWNAPSMLRTDSSVTLEGLTLRRISRLVWEPGRKPCLVASTGPSLTARDCRFVLDAADRKNACLYLTDLGQMQLDNCRFEHEGCEAMFLRTPPQSRYRVDTCTFHGAHPFFIAYGARDVPRVDVSQCTLVAEEAAFEVHVAAPDTFLQRRNAGPLQLAVRDSQIRAKLLVRLSVKADYAEDELMAILRRGLKWSDDGCRFSIASYFLGLSCDGVRVTPSGIEGLDQWRQFWHKLDQQSPAAERRQLDSTALPEPPVSLRETGFRP